MIIHDTLSSKLIYNVYAHTSYKPYLSLSSAFGFAIRYINIPASIETWAESYASYWDTQYEDLQWLEMHIELLDGSYLYFLWFGFLGEYGKIGQIILRPYDRPQ